MRKAINISALLFFTWLILDAYALHDKIMLFFIIGEIPGTTITLSPTIMLAIMSGLIGLIIFESMARHFGMTRNVQRAFQYVSKRRTELPSRRFTRV